MKSKNYILSILLSLLFFSNHSYSQQFTSVSVGAIVTTASGSRSCNFIDYNNDGFEDILITNGTTGGEDNMLYMNNGDETFTLIDDIVNQDNNPSDGSTCADYNNDGNIDIFTVNWYNDDNLLYLNDSEGGFFQIDSGHIATGGGYSETASWGDADQDGFVDLYVTNSAGVKKNYLYKNHGNGYFEKMTGQNVVDDAYFSRCVNWIDYDNDGDDDIFVTNENNQANNLYRNDGDFVFTKILTGNLVSDLSTTMSASWGDIDNDGDFDVFVSNYNQSNRLYENDGEGNFSAITEPWSSDGGCSFSSSFADYDNDGDLDIFVTNGYCQNDLKNYLYQNDGSGAFTLIENEAMTLDSGGSYGCAWGDYNNDGQLDLVVANWQNETQSNSLYKNDGNENNWVKISLEGDESNKSAIGTVVKLKSVINGESVWQMRHISAQSGYCSQNSLVAHFGLGDGTSIDSLIIEWPSGNIDNFTDLIENTHYSIIESGDLETLGLIEHKMGSSSLDVYPNPFIDSIEFKYDGSDIDAQVSVFDIHGKELLIESVYFGLNRLNLNSISKSALLIVLTDSKGIYTQKIIRR